MQEKEWRLENKKVQLFWQTLSLKKYHVRRRVEAEK